MTISLLLRVEGQVPSEQVERLLTNSELTAVADGAHHPRAGEAINDLCESRVHSIGRRDLVADQPAFGAGAVDPATVHNGLSREPVAEKARQAQVGHTRNDALLASGQRE